MAGFDCIRCEGGRWECGEEPSCGGPGGLTRLGYIHFRVDLHGPYEDCDPPYRVRITPVEFSGQEVGRGRPVKKRARRPK